MAKAHQANLDRLAKQLEEVQTKFKSLRVHADAKQVSLQAGEAAVQRRRHQLLEAKSNTEYQALKDQIAADEMANSVLADEALELMEKADEAGTAVATAEATVAKARDEADKHRQDYEGEAPAIQGDVRRLEAELEDDRGRADRRLPQSLSASGPGQGGDALAPVHGEFCGGCNQHVPLNLCSGLMLSKPVCCKSCGRLLYIPEDYVPAIPRME